MKPFAGSGCCNLLKNLVLKFLTFCSILHNVRLATPVETYQRGMRCMKS